MFILLVPFVVFLAIGAFLLIRPVTVIRWQYARHAGQPVPDSAAVRIVERAPRIFLWGVNGDSPRVAREKLIANPAAYPRMVLTIRLGGAMLVFVGAMGLLSTLL